MKILIIAATHGDELLGIRLYEKLLRDRSPLLESIDFMIGNPRALSARKRYIDNDLNRSYQATAGGYEVWRASEIRDYISLTKPDLVLDMHTTNCIQPSCLIIGSMDGEAKHHFLAASHIEVLLQVGLKGDIASVIDNVVGYEVSNSSITPSLLDRIALDLSNFIEGKEVSSRKQLFKITDKMYKKDVTEDQARSFINFEMSPMGFIPIMTGENSYKRHTDYVGFKSLPPELVVL